jgi:hypothetical protein
MCVKVQTWVARGPGREWGEGEEEKERELRGEERRGN